MACKNILLFFSLFLIGSTISQASILQVDTNNDSFFVGSEGTINIVCIPSEPIVAYECKIVYDPEMIQINAIDQGDFFDTFDTYSSPNITINNSEGSIRHAYELILGPQGNITEEGILLSINFTAADTIGSTGISLENAGLTNWTMYVPMAVKNKIISVHNSTYPRWDITQDGRTDAADISTVVAHYGQESTDPENDLWDVIINGKCDAQDISVLVAKYGG